MDKIEVLQKIINQINTETEPLRLMVSIHGDNAYSEGVFDAVDAILAMLYDEINQINEDNE